MVCRLGPKTPTATHLPARSPGCAASRRRLGWQLRNAVGCGEPVSFTLYPQAAPTLLAHPTSSLYGRAGFATKHLWVTEYDPAERYSAGDFVNQHPGGGGLPAYAGADRNLDGTNVVLWHTFGPTHFPRPEDWPVMPVDRCGFTMKPTGFFGRNPTLDVPASVGGSHCHPDTAHEH
jgi:primary-amine oxidase